MRFGLSAFSVVLRREELLSGWSVRLRRNSAMSSKLQIRVVVGMDIHVVCSLGRWVA